MRAGHQVKVLSTETMNLYLKKGLANLGYGISASLKVLGEEYDVVHGHNLPSAIAVKTAKAEIKVLTLHGVYSRQIRLLYGHFMGRAAGIWERQFLKGIDALTVVSLEAAKYYRSLGFDVLHIPNAVDLSEMPDEVERVSDPQITYLGRLSREKGVDLLIEAALMGLKGIVVAGDGPLRSMVEYAAQRGFLKFLGPLPRERALRILAGSDVVVLPSREEGVSTVLLEAMALRIPIVATKVGGTREVVRGGEEAVLISPTPREIMKAVKLLLADEEYARRLAEKAYRRVKTTYDWALVEKQYLKLYNSLLTRSRLFSASSNNQSLPVGKI